jgi:hypothetical protein
MKMRHKKSKKRGHQIRAGIKVLSERQRSESSLKGRVLDRHCARPRDEMKTATLNAFAGHAMMTFGAAAGCHHAGNAFDGNGHPMRGHVPAADHRAAGSCQGEEEWREDQGTR